jgi:RNA polymerase sigma factor (sigma-70 family)
MMSDLLETVTRAAASDVPLAERQAAFGELVRRFQDFGFGCAYAMLGDFHLAQDATQDAFLLAWRGLSTLQHPAGFPGWLRQIVTRRCMDLRRGRGAPELLDAAAGLPAREPTAGEVLDAREEARRVRLAMRALPEAERVVATLCYLGEQSQAEVAAFLEISVDTVKNRLRSARARLRKTLTERMVEMAGDEMKPQRPSRDERFVTAVQELIAAAESGDRERAASLLQDRPGLAGGQGSRPFWEGGVPGLVVAADRGNREIADLLLEHGADVNARSTPPDGSEHGWAPLHVALGDPEMAAHLIARGALVDIFAAAGLGDEARVRALLDEDPARVRATGPDGATALHFASTAAVARLLLDRGADLEARDAFHAGTPLRWACQRGSADVIRLLRARGASADVFLLCALGDVPRLRALLAEDSARARALGDEKDVLRGGGAATPLHVAAFYGQAAAVDALLAAGADVNARSTDGSLPIHDAAHGGSVPTAETLLRHGADLNDRDHRYDATPLAVARYFGKSAMAEFLAGRGAA